MLESLAEKFNLTKVEIMFVWSSVLDKIWRRRHHWTLSNQENFKRSFSIERKHFFNFIDSRKSFHLYRIHIFQRKERSRRVMNYEAVGGVLTKRILKEDFFKELPISKVRSRKVFFIPHFYFSKKKLGKTAFNTNSVSPWLSRAIIAGSDSITWNLCFSFL